MLKDFREFMMKGNVLDLAVAVIIGGAFGLIVASFVKDVIMPPIGLMLGQVDFANLMLVLKEGATPGPYATVEAAQQAGAVTLNYGLFLNTIVNFVIIALAVFLVVKAADKAKRKPTEEVGPVPTDEVILLTEIRDLLKADKATPPGVGPV